MNIFRKYTRKSLAANRARTLVTIIGIVLSMALLTAVIEGAYSGIQFLIRDEIDYSGSWEVFFNETDEETQRKIQSQSEIKKTTYWRQAGWAEIASQNEYKPYLLIESVAEDFTDLVKVRLIAGRLAENSSEIVLPEHLMSNGGLNFSVGDIINISVGRRVDKESGRELETEIWSMGEAIVDTAEKTYTVVGIYERFDNNIETYSCAGYTALTAGEASGPYGTFATVRHVSKIYSYLDSITRPDAQGYITEKYRTHGDLIHYYGTVSNNGIQSVIYGFATILVVLIAFGSISLIYNSFSISLSERTRQFGILKSIGATKKQLRSSVIYEALVLGAIGIPVGMIVGCAGIGITLYCLRNNFAMFSRGTGTKMAFVLSVPALLIAAVVCLIVILISAYIPAARAVRIQPIDAIRQTRDTKIRAGAVKTSKLTSKLFGFEGMMASKNFKRNRKSYRATIISLFMSVVLFISASSFCSYLTDSVEGIVSKGTDLDIYYSRSGYGVIDPEDVMGKLSDISGVKRRSFICDGVVSLKLDESALTDEYKEYTGMRRTLPDGTAKYELETVLAFINDDEFRQILKDNGLNENIFYNADSPKALLYNNISSRYFIDGVARWAKYEAIKSSRLPLTMKLWVYKEFDGYTRYDVAEDPDRAYYFPDEYMDEFWNSGLGIDELDRSKAMALGENESVIKTDIVAAAEIKTTSLLLSSNSCAVIYPYSMLGNVLKDDETRKQTLYETALGFVADDHAKAFEDIKNVLISEGIDTSRLQDIAESRNSERMVVSIVNVFSYGFIILISLIALANVFNTISTSIMLRRREFAMLKSIGLSERGFSKMMNYECIIYGLRSLLFGIPVAVLVTYWIWRVVGGAMDLRFYLPWKGVIIAVASVFIVVFATMLYATSRIRRDNPIDALKNENL